MSYLIDSNVIIDYLELRFSGDNLLKVRNIFNSSFNITTVTKIEVLGFSSGLEELDIKTEAFTGLANLFDLTSEVIDQTINIRKKRKIKIADAIIAATAISNQFTLITTNTKDFIGIKGLKIIDPYSL